LPLFCFCPCLNFSPHHRCRLRNISDGLQTPSPCVRQMSSFPIASYSVFRGHVKNCAQSLATSPRFLTLKMTRLQNRPCCPSPRSDQRRLLFFSFMPILLLLDRIVFHAPGPLFFFCGFFCPWQLWFVPSFPLGLFRTMFRPGNKRYVLVRSTPPPARDLSRGFICSPSFFIFFVEHLRRASLTIGIAPPVLILFVFPFFSFYRNRPHSLPFSCSTGCGSFSFFFVDRVPIRKSSITPPSSSNWLRSPFLSLHFFSFLPELHLHYEWDLFQDGLSLTCPVSSSPFFLDSRFILASTV